MKNNSRVMIFHLKELLYIVFFLLIGIALIILLFFLCFPKTKAEDKTSKYSQGIYSQSITVDDVTMDVAVNVDANTIKDLNLLNCPDEIRSSYPLLISSFEDVRKKVLSSQSLNITYDRDYAYTYEMILDAIEQSLKDAKN